MFFTDVSVKTSVPIPSVPALPPAPATQSSLSGARKRLEIGNIHFDNEAYDQAIIEYNAAIQIDPNNEWAYISRGDVYFNKNDFDKSIADYSAAIQVDPNFLGFENCDTEIRLSTKFGFSSYFGLGIFP